jgi:putative ABC transport system permease protein
LADRGRAAQLTALVWLSGLIRRRRLRLLGTALAVGAAVSILASLGSFFSVSKARMTRQATASVPVDWQVLLAPGVDTAAAEQVIASVPGVAVQRRVAYADTTGLAATTGQTQQRTGSGKVLGLPSDYGSAFPGEIRVLAGAGSGVLLGQQTAANLHAAPGTVVEIGRLGLAPAAVTVDGVVDLPHADSLFQAVGAPPGTGPQAPPDNVLLLPEAVWQQVFAPIAPSHPDLVRTQIHVRLSRALLPDPAAAFSQVTARAHNLEVRLTGQASVGNNLAARLDAARSDAVYVQLLFLLLGLPGVAVAALLASAAGAAGRSRRRREQALLRLRGAAPSALVRLAAVEAAFSALVGVGAGLAGAAVAARVAFGGWRFGTTASQAWAWAGAAAAAGVALAAVAILLPAWRDARLITVAAARGPVGRPRDPLWARLRLDLLALAAGGAVFWQATRNAYQVVVVPEGVPTISVSYFTLLAPLLFWIGGTLLIWRGGNSGLARGRRPLAALVRPLAGGLSGLAAASMARQRRLLSRGLTLLALTAAFAVSTAVFNATYSAQAKVDAQLTNGADVAVTARSADAGLPDSLLGQVRHLPKVAAAQPLLHRHAYVGNDLQDLFGVDPAGVGSATTLSNAFFSGLTARRAMAALQATPDGVLVSEETMKDFQLTPGDLVRLRLQSAADGAFHPVAFRFIGVVREFPTAPRDSFLVANASYVARATGVPAAQSLLVRTSSPSAVAGAIRRILGPAAPVEVTDLGSQLAATLSGLTAVDLRGLTTLELAYAVVLAAAAAGLVLALSLSERRRTFAIATALGARRRQLGAFVWSETAFVTLGGVVAGTLAGWGLAFVLVKILTGVFDPPPETLAIPWSSLGGLGVVIALGALAAGAANLAATRRPVVELIRDL